LIPQTKPLESAGGLHHPFLAGPVVAVVADPGPGSAPSLPRKLNCTSVRGPTPKASKIALTPPRASVALDPPPLAR
jgi:hypothetical protein